ncbi:MAG: acyl-CoA dehydrogenase family protein [Burkholderiaceae bacterium]
MVVEELCRGWMACPASSTRTNRLRDPHVRQRRAAQSLPARHGARREARRARLTEAHAGSDAQRIRTVAVKKGDQYVVNGSKMWSTNARTGTMFGLVVKTDPNANPPHKGMTL